MRTAVIDIGTNSVRLLIADKSPDEIKIIKTGLVTTRLGEGIGEGFFLLRPAIERTLKALNSFRQEVDKACVDKIVVAATSAVRDAANRQDFLAEVLKQTGWTVRVVSGTEEAELSYLGAITGLKARIRNPVVIDIGGGSTEFIWERNDCLNCVSIRLGAVRMTEAGLGLTDIRKMLAELFGTVKADGFGILVGVGGTVTALAAVDQKLTLYNPDLVHGYFLKRQVIKNILRNFEGMTTAERKQVPGLQPQRADIITAGARILLAVVEGLETNGILVSETDIMYGLLIKNSATKSGDNLY